jgi:hypothetical protein
MPHLAVPFLAGHASGSGRYGCRLSSRPLPQCPRAPAAVARVSTVPAACELRVSAGCVCGRRFGPPMSAGCADLARNPGRPRGRTPPRCPLDVRECGRLLAGRPLSAADTAAAPLSRAGTWRSPAADRPCTPRRRWQWTPTAADGVHGGSTNLAAGGCPDQGVRRPAYCRWRRTLRQCPPVRPALRPLGCRPDGWGPPRTPPPPAGVRCYRKRSPDRWPLVWCRHRR